MPLEPEGFYYRYRPFYIFLTLIWIASLRSVFHSCNFGFFQKGWPAQCRNNDAALSRETSLLLLQKGTDFLFAGSRSLQAYRSLFHFYSRFCIQFPPIQVNWQRGIVFHQL